MKWTDPSGAPLVRLAEAMQVPDEQLLASLEPVLDVERFITYWALELLVAHCDGYTSNRNNFYVYFDPDNVDRAVFVPWGTDEVMLDIESDVSGPADFVRSELARRLSRVPDAHALLTAELQRLLDEVWSEPALLADIDHYAALVRRVENAGYQDEELQQLRSWISARRGQLEDALAVGLPAGEDTPAQCTDYYFVQTLLDLLQKLGYLF